jgi:hypothetical protein
MISGNPRVIRGRFGISASKYCVGKQRLQATHLGLVNCITTSNLMVTPQYHCLYAYLLQRARTVLCFMTLPAEYCIAPPCASSLLLWSSPFLSMGAPV